MELHVAGVLVRTRAADTQGVAARLAGLSGAEVHAAAPDGRLVLTLEAADARTLSGRLADVPLVPGVLSAVLVYEHHEPLEEAQDGSS